ncbi:MAG: ornithine carbamoyltransferase [Deltaproteobacteria bacterium]|nr:ornithine carbamoyltransferase [Deltaproteobacteria bacterium]
MSKRDLLSLRDISRAEIGQLFSLARRLKREQKQGILHRLLKGKTLALIFEKPSLRTRVSFETGMAQLGGHAVFLGPQEIQLGVRETPSDCARSLSRWVDIIVARTFSQEVLEEMAGAASVPVVNGLTDLFHPCQVLTDCFTLLEHKRRLEGLKIVFVGDGNNMVHSWMQAAVKFPFSFVLACPKGYEPDPEVTRAAKEGGGRITITHRVEETMRGADVIYTDVWTSMGQESEAEIRRKVFKGYQVNEALVALARKEAVVMHCLPAHRGEEITREVLEGPRSIAFDQAENRLHVQKAILLWILGIERSRAKGLKGKR